MNNKPVKPWNEKLGQFLATTIVICAAALVLCLTAKIAIWMLF